MESQLGDLDELMVIMQKKNEELDKEKIRANEDRKRTQGLEDVAQKRTQYLEDAATKRAMDRTKSNSSYCSN